MMFGRQWFPFQSQYGISHAASLFEELINRGDLASSRHLIISSYSDNSRYWNRMWRRLKWLEKRRGDTYSQPIKYSIFGFWPDMDPLDCQILDLFKAAIPSLKWSYTDKPSNADIAFVSCYAPDYEHYFSNSQQALRVLFLGENIRPRFDEFDLALSFDQLTYSGRNIYFPLWLLEIDWFNKVSYSDRNPLPLDAITEDRTVSMESRLARACYVGNNNEPLRMSLIEAVRSMGGVIDCFGSQSTPVANKIELLKNYRVLLSPENSYYPGYTTEKPIHGHIAGCYTIYWGSPDPALNIANNPAYISIDCAVGVDNAAKKIIEAINNNQPITHKRLIERYDAEALFSHKISRIRSALMQFTHL